MTRTLTAALALAAALILIAATVGAGTSTAADSETYIVKLAEPPLASYKGGIAGLAATNPAARGEVKLDPSSAASRAYLAYLDARQDAVLGAIRTALGRSVSTQFTYSYAYNGFALALSPSEAAAVADLPGVAGIQQDYTRHPVTDAGPQWIGAPAVWGGNAGPSATKGEGVVVGVIDTGVNATHPSFADVGGDGYDHSNPRGQFYGACDPITGAPFCNDKLIGVWDFTGTSPADDNGHGSHTASTAAGNAHSATMDAPTISVTREISGVAPHANLITYKACIAVGCLGASLTAAIDQATADGVDVINYSIGGGPTNPWNDSDSEAFLAAREAGVIVSTSAGNDGPGPETVGSPANAPWVMTIGASTHNRKLLNSLVDLSGGNSAAPGDIEGKSFTAGYGPAEIVYAGDYGDPLCQTPFAPGTFDGEIVICDRGVNPRVEKGRNVKAGGAGGMVHANDKASGDSTVADPHELPATHISYDDGVALKAWVASGGTPTGTIAGTTFDVADANGDIMASFSSRGPNKPAPDVVKPDVTAPGVDVLAAWNTPGASYNVISGTSMSSPHSAGAAALVRALHPDWTPAEVQSAITSTGKTDGIRKEDAATAADPFDMGGGRVDLTQAGLAGLVLNETGDAYWAADPSAGGDPTGLNLATLGNSACAGVCTWTRTVRNALGSEATWSTRVSAPQGVGVTVKPRRFTLAPDATLTLTITADVRKAEAGRWHFGGVELTSRDAVAQHLTMAVMAGMVHPVEIDTASTTGTHTVSVPTAIDVKDLSVAVYGLTEGVVEDRTLVQDPTPLDPYDGLVGTFTVLLDVEDGSKFIAAEIADTTANDLDLFVGRDLNGDGTAQENEELCRSASETAFEACTVRNLTGGTYWVMVQNWLSGTAADSVSLLVSTVPGTDAGNLTATGPTTAAAGTSFDVTLNWNEPAMEVDDVWFGLVDLGSDRKNPGNVGSILVKLTRTG